MNYLGTTIGLQTTAGFARVEYSRAESGGPVALTAVSARNLNRIGTVPIVKISAEEFEGRPCDPYDDIAQARWAFEKIGLYIAGE